VRRGAYPGTFDPPTVAHLAIAEAARSQCGLDRVDMIVNRAPLGKQHMRPLETRIAMLDAIGATRPWLCVAVTDRVHLADIAEGYDALILGADKWAQVVDPAFYDSAAERDTAVARLPALAIAPRHGMRIPDDCVVLDVDLSHVSSTAARSGHNELILPEVLPFLRPDG
jgi:cytidyltransferase-like protein